MQSEYFRVDCLCSFFKSVGPDFFVSFSILVALAEVECSLSRPQDLTLHQTALGQVRELPFGVTITGSHSLFTYDLVRGSVSYITSFFLFLYGVTVSGGGIAQ